MKIRRIEKVQMNEDGSAYVRVVLYVKKGEVLEDSEGLEIQFVD